jgi:hypothetical protein
LTKFPVVPGQRFEYAKYLVPASDILPHLLHEHQAGFVNRVLEASYRSRLAVFAGTPKKDETAAELTKQANVLTRYLLFADEVPLPAGGVEGDPDYRRDFAMNRKVARDGTSLKDFDLQTRLFKYRCSYMIYSAVFEGLPVPMKQMVYRRIKEALSIEKPEKEYAYLPAEEKRAIRTILSGTLTDLPPNW